MHKDVFSMANRLFQGVIHQMKDCIDRTFGVIDENFTVTACSELGKIGEVVPSFNLTIAFLTLLVVKTVKEKLPNTKIYICRKISLK